MVSQSLGQRQQRDRQNGIDIKMIKPLQGALGVKNPPANVGDIRDAGSIPGLGRSPGGGHGNPPQYSCLENPMDRGARQAAAQGSESRTHCRGFTGSGKREVTVLGPGA